MVTGLGAGGYGVYSIAFAIAATRAADRLVGPTAAADAGLLVVRDGGAQLKIGVMASGDAGARLQAFLHRPEVRARLLGEPAPPIRRLLPLRPIARIHADRILVVGNAGGRDPPGGTQRRAARRGVPGALRAAVAATPGRRASDRRPAAPARRPVHRRGDRPAGAGLRRRRPARPRASHGALQLASRAHSGAWPPARDRRPVPAGPLQLGAPERHHGRGCQYGTPCQHGCQMIVTRVST